MNWFTKALGFIFGGSGGAIKEVGDAIDKNTTTDEERGALDVADTASARTFAQPGNNPGLINQLVDAFNRFIRPGITIWLIGGFSGWWKLPDTHTVDPVWFTIFITVVSFWFGGRLLLQDLPKTIAALLKLKGK